MLLLRRAQSPQPSAQPKAWRPLQNGRRAFSADLDHTPAPTASSAVTASGDRVSMKELTEKTALPGPATP